MAGLPGAAGSASLVEEHFPNAKWLLDVSDYYLPLAPTWVEFKARLSRNIRESLRKCHNAPERDGISISHTVVQDVSDVAEAIDRFLYLHQARSELSGTIRHNDVFATESTRHFLVDVCQRFAARGALRIFQLSIAKQVVATRIGFIMGDSLYLYYSGYDPAYAKYSVMTTVVAEAIRWAIGEGLQTVNLSTGKDASKQRWGPEHIVYRNALVVSPSLRGKITHHTYSTVRRSLESIPIAAQLRALFSRRS